MGKTITKVSFKAAGDRRVKKEADDYLHGKYAVVQGDLFEKDKGKVEE